MRTLRQAGPFTERPYFTDEEMETACLDALCAGGFCPATPSPIRIDRFAEKHFRLSLKYEDLPDGVLGFTRFSKKGVEDIVIARALDADNSKPARRRIRSTVAHEAGHGLFHAYLYAQAATQPEFIDPTEPQNPKVLCRDVEGEVNNTQHGYRGKWWEFQANRAIGALLLPRHLVALAVDQFLVASGSLGNRILDENRRDKAVLLVADSFDVNPAVAKIRVNGMYPFSNAKQMEL